jgi:Flp pilus assembly protein TadG
MRRFRRGSDRTGERGASLVEFALVLPVLLVLLFGIIEASWAFAQHNDVRHGAREGARLAAVDFGNTVAIANEVCARMDVVSPADSPKITLDPKSANGNLGGLAQITVESNLTSLTGFVDGLIGNLNLTSTIEFRIEQPTSASEVAQWWNGGMMSDHTCGP